MQASSVVTIQKIFMIQQMIAGSWERRLVKSHVLLSFRTAKKFLVTICARIELSTGVEASQYCSQCILLWLSINQVKVGNRHRVKEHQQLMQLKCTNQEQAKLHNNK